MIDLNRFLSANLAAAGWYLFQGSDINDEGIIVGFAANGPDLDTALFAPFKLTPIVVPVPGAVWLLGSVVAGFVGMSRRKQAVRLNGIGIEDALRAGRDLYPVLNVSTLSVTI